MPRRRAKPGRRCGSAIPPFLTAAAVLLLVGCSGEAPGASVPRPCAQAGCDSQVTFIFPRFTAMLNRYASLTVEACLDNRCAQGVLPTGRCQGEGDLLVTSGLGCRSDAIIYHLAPSQEDLAASSRHTATLTIVAQDKTILLLEEVERVSFTRVQPNGPDCPPTCYQADIRLPTA